MELFCELFVISSRTVSSAGEYGISQLHIFFHLLSTSEYVADRVLLCEDNNKAFTPI